MRIFALSDPHLSAAHPKPMDVFGQNWRDHPARIAENWRRVVRDDDVVRVYDTETFAELAALPADKPSGIFFSARAHRIGQ